MIMTFCARDSDEGADVDATWEGGGGNLREEKGREAGKRNNARVGRSASV
jgi:hypothetical protein